MQESLPNMHCRLEAIMLVRMCDAQDSVITTIGRDIDMVKAEMQQDQKDVRVWRMEMLRGIQVGARE